MTRKGELERTPEEEFLRQIRDDVQTIKTVVLVFFFATLLGVVVTVLDATGSL